MNSDSQPKRYTAAFLDERENTIRDMIIAMINERLSDEQREALDVDIKVRCETSRRIVPVFNAHIKANIGNERYAMYYPVTCADAYEGMIKNDAKVVVDCFFIRYVNTANNKKLVKK